MDVSLGPPPGFLESKQQEDEEVPPIVDSAPPQWDHAHPESEPHARKRQKSTPLISADEWANIPEPGTFASTLAKMKQNFQAFTRGVSSRPSLTAAASSTSSSSSSSSSSTRSSFPSSSPLAALAHFPQEYLASIYRVRVNVHPVLELSSQATHWLAAAGLLAAAHIQPALVAINTHSRPQWDAAMAAVVQSKVPGALGQRFLKGCQKELDTHRIGGKCTCAMRVSPDVARQLLSSAGPQDQDALSPSTVVVVMIFLEWILAELISLAGERDDRVRDRIRVHHLREALSSDKVLSTIVDINRLTVDESREDYGWPDFDVLGALTVYDDRPWWEAADVQHKKKLALDKYLGGQTSSVYRRYFITPICYLGIEMHDDRQVDWSDFDVEDASGRIWHLRQRIDPGDADANTGAWGEVRCLDTGLVLLELDGYGHGDSVTLVREKPSCKEFVAHPASSLPSDDDFEEDSFLSNEFEPSPPSQLARLCTVAFGLGRHSPDIWVARQPLALRVEFAAEGILRALAAHNYCMPRDLALEIAAFVPAILPSL